MCLRRHKRLTARAFTLVELLVVIAIIGILVSLLLPAVQAARERGRQTQCLNNLKNLGLAAINYESTNRMYPPASPAVGYVTWPVLILPFMEETNLYEMWHTEKKYEDALNKEARETSIATHFCPSNRQPPMVSSAEAGTGIPVGAVGDFAACAGDGFVDTTPDPDIHWELHTANGVIISADPLIQGWSDKKLPGASDLLQIRSSVNSALVRDGLSKTIILGEKHINPQHYGLGTNIANADGSIYNGNSPRQYMRVGGPYGALVAQSFKDTPADNNVFGSFHPTITHYSLADGSTRSISNSIDSITFGNLCNRSDGKNVSVEF